MRSLSLVARGRARRERAMLVGMEPELSVVVVHHRTPEVLQACLLRLAQSVPEADVVLVDTAPEPEVLRRASALHPRVSVVVAPNHSLAHAVNVGLRRVATPLVAAMNADAYVEPDTFERLVAVLRSHPRAGVVGPLARTPSGRRQDHGPLYHPNYVRLSLRPAGSVRVPWLPGFLQVIRREVLERVGGYDPSLRFYNEDVEFCLRVRADGWTCRLVDTPVLHLGGSSTPAAAAFMVEGVRGGYQLSRRYLPPALRRAHRTALLAWGTVGGRFARDPERRRALIAIGTMARHDAFDTSPFGATLQDAHVASPDRP